MTSARDGLPPLATTGVGSLPFAQAAAAARHAIRAYDVPFCPQLPRLEGDMVQEWLGSDPGRCGWSADRDRERPAAWEPFLAELAADPPAHRVVKLQVTGPVTLAVALERSAGRPGAGSAVVGLAREIAAWLAANVGEQVLRLRELGLDVLLLVDEPGLAQAGLAQAEVAVWDPLRATAAAGWGMHVCGVVPWPLVDAIAPDLLSFDVVRFRLGGESRTVLARLLRRGGRVAWGVVDPVAPDGAAAAAERIAAGLAALGMPAGRVAERSLITPSCGSGRLSVRSEHLIAATVHAAKSAMTRNTASGGRRRDPARH